MRSEPLGVCLAVVGAQYGSEGKGVIVNHIAHLFNTHVRVGGPNAGHSLVYQGQVYKMQSLPCGWTNPDARLVLGRGALIDFEQLRKELDLVSNVFPDITKRLLIDRRAAVLDGRHHKIEGGVHGEIHQRIGSTGEGVGAARVARINRDPRGIAFAEDVAGDYGLKDCLVSEAGGYLRSEIERPDGRVLLEGTQGSGLSLIHGPWPYVTSADTNAAQMAVDTGLPPRYITSTMLVVRSHPIRVAGNSGPLKGELSWEELSRELGKEVIEQTTVTRKVRRVGRWDEDLFIRAVGLNAPTSLALTFADYIEPSDEGKTDITQLSPEVHQFVNYLEGLAGAPVVMVGTGWKDGDWQVADAALGEALTAEIF